MTLALWTKQETDEPTRVRLIDEGNGTLALYAVDAKGHRLDNGRIETLSGRGSHRCEDVSSSLGIALNSKGQIEDI